MQYGSVPLVMHSGGAKYDFAIGVDQVDMNGDFASVHCIVPGRHDFRLPFPARVINVKSGLEEPVRDGVLQLEMSAGETCWFRIHRIRADDETFPRR